MAGPKHHWSQVEAPLIYAQPVEMPYFLFGHADAARRKSARLHRRGGPAAKALPRATDKPLASSPLELELDTTIRGLITVVRFCPPPVT